MKLTKKDLRNLTTSNLINILAAGISLVLLFAVAGFGVELDQSSAEPGQWGYRPAAGSLSQVNPPSFSWRPQEGLTWEIQCASDAALNKIQYHAEH